MRSPGLLSTPRTFPPDATDLSDTTLGIGWNRSDQVRLGDDLNGARYESEMSTAFWYMAALILKVRVINV